MITRIILIVRADQPAGSDHLNKIHLPSGCDARYQLGRHQGPREVVVMGQRVPKIIPMDIYVRVHIFGTGPHVCMYIGLLSSSKSDRGGPRVCHVQVTFEGQFLS